MDWVLLSAVGFLILLVSATYLALLDRIRRLQESTVVQVGDLSNHVAAMDYVTNRIERAVAEQNSHTLERHDELTSKFDELARVITEEILDTDDKAELAKRDGREKFPW